ncbi:methyl-accepting chemotaxis protein [Treponema sp.]|uniref:methyl-accepting chemotaxis protein n=1 Tax=Treponema sp. TaxID=166 RepID=UPI0025EBABAA|nr:methyl-accepting chemotaxis protein [Treponema sp.]MCR5218033.1 methyl-accepting chemotaxis protein [Treponema sp.]
MEQAKQKNGKLFILIAMIIALTVIILDAVQILVVSASARTEIQKDTYMQYKELSNQSALVYEHQIDSYLSKMDYYANADIVQQGASTDAIVKWMTNRIHNRSDVFEYIGYVDKNGVNWTDNGDTSNVSGADYYQAIIKKGEDEFIDNPVEVSGRTIVHVCKAAKYKDKTIGFFYGVMDPETVSDALAQIDLGSVGDLAIYGSNGTLVGSSIPSDISRANMEKIKSEQPDSYSQLSRAWSSEEEISGTITNENGNSEVFFSRNVAGTPWKLFVMLNETRIYTTAMLVTNLLIIGGIVLAVLIVLVVGVMLFRSLKPLTVVEETIRGIATGDADLTQRIHINTNNEIGRVVDGFNQFSAKLQEIIRTMKNSKEKLVDVGELLQDSTDDTAAAITEIISNIESLGGQVGYQTESVHQTAGAVNEIASNIESLNRMIESQSTAVTQASAAVEQMIGNINSVNTSVQKMAESFKDLEQKTIVGVQKQNDVNTRIEEIERESQALQEANAVISGIAEQTNLLAMNAAIEAAHAGEAGKGFSVVADEIRKLSEDSSSQSQTIGKQLSTITASIESIVSASQVASNAFNEVLNGINSTNNLVHEITNAMLEQNEGSKQISVALNSMNDTSNEVKTASVEMAEGNKAILSEIKRLQEATFSIKDGMTEMSTGARKINETGAALADLSNQMKESIEDIGNEVDKFKV